MSRLDDLRAAGFIPCEACGRAFAEVIPIRVGRTWGEGKIERIPLCGRCVHGVWMLWPVRK